MTTEIKQWPDNICSGQIRYGRASNYDGFYLADVEHGIPTFGSVADTEPTTIRGQYVHAFNYPGQTEEIAKQLVHRWNCHKELLEALEDARYALYGTGPGNPKIDAAIAKAKQV